MHTHLNHDVFCCDQRFCGIANYTDSFAHTFSRHTEQSWFWKTNGMKWCISFNFHCSCHFMNIKPHIPKPEVLAGDSFLTWTLQYTIKHNDFTVSHEFKFYLWKVLCITSDKLLVSPGLQFFGTKNELDNTCHCGRLRNKWDNRIKTLRLVPCTKGKVIPSLFFSFPWQKWTKDQTDFRIHHNQFYSWRDPTILISHTNIRNMTVKASLTAFFFVHQVKQFHKLEAFTDFFF